MAKHLGRVVLGFIHDVEDLKLLGVLGCHGVDFVLTGGRGGGEEGLRGSNRLLLRARHACTGEALCRTAQYTC